MTNQTLQIARHSTTTTVTLGEPSHYSDEVTVKRNDDSTVTLTVLVGVDEQGDPTECFASLTLPADAWRALAVLGLGDNDARLAVDALRGPRASANDKAAADRIENTLGA